MEEVPPTPPTPAPEVGDELEAPPVADEPGLKPGFPLCLEKKVNFFKYNVDFPEEDEDDFGHEEEDYPDYGKFSLSHPDKL